MSHHSLPLIAGDKIDKRKVSKTRFPISINKKKSLKSHVTFWMCLRDVTSVYLY